MNGDISMNRVLKINNSTASNSIEGSKVGALYVGGGTRIDGNLNVLGSAYFKDEITVDGCMNIMGDTNFGVIIETLGNKNYKWEHRTKGIYIRRLPPYDR